MGYGVKWVKDNLGITRSALRMLEEKKLMPENEGENPRNYSDEDIERIWTIRVLQGIGYTLSELYEMQKDDGFDCESTLENKIQELEAKKAQMEKLIGYAKCYKLTGRFPYDSKDIGKITFKEYQENALENWNVNSDPEIRKGQEIIDKVIKWNDENIDEDEFFQVMEYAMKLDEKLSNKDALFLESVLPREILKRKKNGPADTEVQLLVKMLYENNSSLVSDMTKDFFVRCASSCYMVGDVAKIHEQEFGKEGCRFIADAIAVFGGYSCYEDIKN